MLWALWLFLFTVSPDRSEVFRGRASNCGSGEICAHAAGPPSFVSISSDDIRITESPRVDFLLRLALIRQASVSVDLVTYDIRPDEMFTKPLLQALREAANRGVRVRILLPWVPHVTYDADGNIPRFLLTPRTKTPILVMMFGGPVLSGWGSFDSAHEKLMIVDNQKVIISGRGLADDYLHWLDTTFLVKGRLIYQSTNSFFELWREVRRKQRLYVDEYVERGEASVVHWRGPHGASLQVSKVDEQMAQESLAWFDSNLEATEEPPCQARLLHHDYVRQISALSDAPFMLTERQKIRGLVDPVLNSLVDRLYTATHVRISTISAMLHPKLKRALIEAAKRGADVTLLTNVAMPKPFSTSTRRITAGGPMWSTELPDLSDLAGAGVKIFQFQTNSQVPWNYLHRKVAIVDDAVIFGSHNFNLPSTISNDEMSIEAICQPFTEKMTALFDADLAISGQRLSVDWLRQQNTFLINDIVRFVSRPFLGTM